MIQVNAISLNETRWYNLKEEDKPFIKEIRATYAYNPNSCTHLCELTPSYDLRYLHTYLVWNEEPSDSKKEELEERYAHCGNEDTYMHCSTVKSLDCPKKECGEFEDMEEACEYLQGNWPF